MRKMRVNEVIVLFLSLLLAGTVSFAADAPGLPVRVAILPFSMHTPPNLSYLQDGIRDMLTSRLAWQGKVQVVDRSATNQALQGLKGEMTLNGAVRRDEIRKGQHVLLARETAG